MRNREFGPGLATMASGQAVRNAFIEQTRINSIFRKSGSEPIANGNAGSGSNILKFGPVLSPFVGAGLTLAAGAEGVAAQQAQYEAFIQEFNDCGTRGVPGMDQTEVLAQYNPNEHIVVVETMWTDGVHWQTTKFGQDDESCPKGQIPVEQAPVVASADFCPTGISFGVPATHEAVPVASMGTAGLWIRPMFNETKATAAFQYIGIGPWNPSLFQNVDAGAAEMTSYGNTGEWIVRGLNGGRVVFGVWQEAQHQNETLVRPDGSVDNNWNNQYTFKGLPNGTQFMVYDPDSGRPYTWDGITPIILAANNLGTMSVELPKGDVRVAFCFNMPAQIGGVQAPEAVITRGPNNRPGLTGENKLLANIPGLIKPGRADR